MMTRLRCFGLRRFALVGADALGGLARRRRARKVELEVRVLLFFLSCQWGCARLRTVRLSATHYLKVEFEHAGGLLGTWVEVEYKAGRGAGGRTEIERVRSDLGLGFRWKYLLMFQYQSIGRNLSTLSFSSSHPTCHASQTCVNQETIGGESSQQAQRDRSGSRRQRKSEWTERFSTTDDHSSNT